MAVGVMAKVWEHFPQGGSELLVMLKLADYANDRGENIHPSISTVAKYARITDRQAQRVMHALIDGGWLEVIGNEDGGRGKSRRYRLRLDRFVEAKKGDMDVTLSSPTKGDARDTLYQQEKDDTNDTLSDRTSQQKGDIHVAKRVTSMTEKGDTHVTRSVKNQQQNRQKKTYGRARARTATPLPDDFALSPAVAAWAQEHRIDRLQERFEHFVDLARSKGYTYRDWDAALRNALRQDWARLSPAKPAAGAPPRERPLSAVEQVQRANKLGPWADPPAGRVIDVES